MEAIRNYLESMFMNLPDTPEVRKAKTELGQLMEDKYTDLLHSGKTENEAVGTVISEFGNLNEIAGDLGIGSVVSKTATDDRRHVTLEEVKAYFTDKGRQAQQTALGVMLCILSPVPTIIFSDTRYESSLGVVLLFIMIAAAVGLFIYSGSMIRDWEFLSQRPCSVDLATTKYTEDEERRARPAYAGMLTAGIALCICSAIPAILLDGQENLNPVLDNISGACVLLFVSVGVFLIILASIRESGYRNILGINAPGTMGGRYPRAAADDSEYSKTVRIILSVYWPTVTCCYLIWSFLTRRWDITWIIWPLAAIACKLIEVIGEKEVKTE
jgi:hypothetical protein